MCACVCARGCSADLTKLHHPPTSEISKLLAFTCHAHIKGNFLHSRRLKQSLLYSVTSSNRPRARVAASLSSFCLHVQLFSGRQITLKSCNEVEGRGVFLASCMGPVYFLLRQWKVTDSLRLGCALNCQLIHLCTTWAAFFKLTLCKLCMLSVVFGFIFGTRYIFSFFPTVHWYPWCQNVNLSQ